MTGSVYPCHACGEQNWVTDIDDNGLCPSCQPNKKMDKSNMEIDYKEAIRNAVAQLRGHVETHNATDVYMINLLDSINDYLFYVEDTTKGQR